MPRSNLVKKDFVEMQKEDLTVWIYGEMKRRSYTTEYMAKLLGVSRPTFSYRMKHGNFEFGELVIIFNALGGKKESVSRLLGVA